MSSKKRSTPKSLLTTQNGFQMLLILIGVGILALVLGGLYYYRSTNTSNPLLTSQSGQNFASLNFKSLNEFYPVSLYGQPIGDVGGTSYKVYEYGGSSYNFGSGNDKISANFSMNYKAYYMTNGQPEKAIIVNYIKFNNTQEIENVRKVNEKLFNPLAGGFRKTTLPISGVEYWAAHRDVPQNKSGELNSGDARLLFPDALTMAIISPFGGYTNDDLGTIVKEYIGLITDTNTEYVSRDQILTLAERSRLKIQQNQDEFNEFQEDALKKFEEEKMEAEENFDKNFR